MYIVSVALVRGSPQTAVSCYPFYVVPTFLSCERRVNKLMVRDRGIELRSWTWKALIIAVILIPHGTNLRSRTVSYSYSLLRIFSFSWDLERAITDTLRWHMEPRFGLEPKTWCLQSNCSSHWANAAYLVGDLGFEPRTSFVSERRSTTELTAVNFGGLGGNRTHVLRVKSPLLMPLSYKPLSIKKGVCAPNKFLCWKILGFTVWLCLRELWTCLKKPPLWSPFFELWLFLEPYLYYTPWAILVKHKNYGWHS